MARARTRDFVYDAKLLTKSTYTGWYCVPCETYWTAADFTPEDLAQPAAQPIARDRGALKARHDDAEPRVSPLVGPPRKLETRRVPAATGVPTGFEVRAAAQAHPARVPLARY